MINFQTHPVAIFYACDTADVADAVQCANKFHVKVSPASGRHGFVGAALPTGYLAIDLRHLNEVSERKTLPTSISPTNKQ
jgi:FAD/FMN-containing dehydrogenase